VMRVTLYKQKEFWVSDRGEDKSLTSLEASDIFATS